MGLLDQSPLAGLLTGYLPTGIQNMQQGNQAIRQGAQATLRKMQGQDLTPEQQAAIQDSPIGGMGVNNIGAAGAVMGTFAGPGSATARMRYLDFAKKAAAKGMDPEAVRAKYGWFQQPVTGDWRYEIPDNTAKLVPTPDPTLKATEFRVKYPRGYQFVHRELMKAYPELKDVTIGIHDPYEGEALATFNRAANHISLRSDLTPDEALKSIIHEYQHTVQKAEGGSPGTSPSSPPINQLAQQKMGVARQAAEAVSQRFNNALNDFFNAQPRPQTMREAGEIRARFMRENAQLAAEYMDAQETLRLLDDPWQQLNLRHSLYERALGETEARDAQERLHFTPDQRRAVPPYKLGMDTADMPIRSPSELFDLRGLLTPED